jgi:hypothetical protein
MPELDYRLIQQAGQVADIPAAKERAYTLANAMDTQQLNKMKLAEAETQSADTEKVRNILKNSDLSTFEGQAKAASEATKINPTIGMELMKGFQAQRSGEADNTKSQYELMSAKNDVIGGAAVQLKMQHDQLAAQGKTEPEINAAMGPQMMATVQNLMSAKLPNGQPVLDDNDKRNLDSMMSSGVYNAQAINSIVANSKQAREVLTQKIAQQKADTEEKRATAYEQSVENTAKNQAEQRRIDQEKVDLSKVKIERTSSGGLTTKSAQMLAEQAAAGDTSALVGLKPADKVKVRNVMADNASIYGMTGADQAAKNAEFKGIQAGQRTLGQRQANIDMAVQEAQNILPILRQASKSVDRGKLTSWNKIIQAADGATSDPELLQFAQAAKSFSNIYTRATVPGASSVTDREEALKHLPIFTSDESFQKVLDIMEKEMQAAKASPHQVRQDLSSSVTGSDRTTLPSVSTPPAAGSAAAPPQSAPAAGGAGMGAAPQTKTIKTKAGSTVELLP